MLQIALALTLVASRTVSCDTAVVTLFDFETDADLAAWHNEGGMSVGPGRSLERPASFAMSGGFATRLGSNGLRVREVERVGRPATPGKCKNFDIAMSRFLLLTAWIAAPVSYKQNLTGEGNPHE